LASRNFDSRSRRLHISSYEDQPVADRTSRKSMPTDGHGRQDGPRIAGRVVGFDGPERRHHVRILEFTAGYINASVDHGISQGAARRGHAGARGAPFVIGRIVFLDDGSIGSRGNKRRSHATTDDVNLSVHYADGRMVARSRHGTSLAPCVRLGIVFFHGPDRSMGRRWAHGDIGGTGEKAYASDYVDLVANRGGHG